MKKAFRGLKRGFTLIELIITIVIVGILAGIAIAGYAAVTESAEDQAAKSTLQSVDREYRANDAFNKMGDRGSVAIADMTEAAELGVTFNDVDGDGMLETDETVTIETSEKTFTLTLEDATQAGEITSSAADDGSSESANPYAEWDSYTHTDGITRYWTAERTGTYSFTVTGVFAGVAPSTTLMEVGNGDMYVSGPELGSGEVIVAGHTSFYDYDGDIQLYTNEHGDAEWTRSVTMPFWDGEGAADDAKLWTAIDSIGWSDPNGTFFAFHMHPWSYVAWQRAAEGSVIPAYTGS